MSFGSVEVGQAGSATVTLTNLGDAGDPDIDVSDITVTGANAGQFSHDFGSGMTLSPGQSSTVTVTFSPTTEGSKSATLEVAHSGTNSPLQVALSGTGTAPPEPSEPGQFFDDFNRPDESLQSSLDWDVIGGTVAVVSNEAKATALDGGWYAARWTAETDGDDQLDSSSSPIPATASANVTSTSQRGEIALRRGVPGKRTYSPTDGMPASGGSE